MLRHCLLAPIPEFDLAADLLGACADALIARNAALAKALLEQANFPSLLDHARRIVGPLNFEVHRQTKVPTPIAKKLRDSARMPSVAMQDQTFIRDGWRCRFCGVRVVCKQARSVLARVFELNTGWTSYKHVQHAGLYVLVSSLDHIVPHARGGSNVQTNFVTACYCCQFGRGNFLLEEVDLENPLSRPLKPDVWDGLTRLRASFTARPSSQSSNVR